MDVYLCEKPSQAKDLAHVLGCKEKADGYLSNGQGKYVTWAFGHLLEMFMPDDYDEQYRQWNMETLPILPQSWRMKAKKSGTKQLKIISSLMDKANRVFIATDYDREGEAIARSILDRVKFRGEIKRVCLTALDETSIRRALSKVLQGTDTVPMYHAALARQRADWLIGMNISRIYTVLAKQAGFNETLHVGRVLTPTVALVCNRDKAIAAFVPAPYCVLTVDVSVQSGHFKARWVAPEECCDPEGHCINKVFANQVANQVKGADATIAHKEDKDGKESPPLPFDLTSLQQYASKRWGYSAQEVLDAAQSLYETHKATTYPRTDCRYLPVSQKDDVDSILQNIILSDPDISGVVAGADSSRKSRVFNDDKVTAHHAIIPTPNKADIQSMSPIEQNLYDAVRRFYIAQFYSCHEFKRTQITVRCGQHDFIAKGKVSTQLGWKVIFGSDAESAPKDQNEAGSSDDEAELSLPKVNHGEPAVVTDSELADKMTRPPAHFTEATLLSAMENVSRFVSEEKFKQILKETAGLGTPATRAGIIEGALAKGYLVRKKTVLLATEKAHALISVLPGAIKSPGMTAAWEQELEKIASSEMSMVHFADHISRWISTLVNEIKDNAPLLTALDGPLKKAFATAGPQTFACFSCGGSLRRLKGSNGFFWLCSNDPCTKTFNDSRGKPVERASLSSPAANAPKCPECGCGMLRKKSKAQENRPSSSFWGCSDYPSCKGTKPIKSRKKTTSSVRT